MARGPPGFLHGWVVLMLSLWHMVLDVAVFWRKRLAQWWARRSPVDLWLEALANAECFEDWEEAAMHLDSLLGLDLW